MFETIKKNKRESLFIVSIFIVVITLIIYYICMSLDMGPISIVIALVFSILSAWSSYYFSDQIVLRLNNARPATREENLQLVNILDSLVVASGLNSTPALYVMDDPQPNAFATGRDPAHSAICVTTGLLDKLDYYELEGVIGHELGHIKNYDIRLSAIVTVMVGFVVMLSDMFSRSMFFGGRRRSRDDGNGNAILMLIGLIFLILSPIFGKLMQLAISRKREFMADATSVQFTRNPDGLISALEKISADPNELQNANTSTAHMFISNPFKEDSKKKFANLFSTHPSTEDRIEALKNLK